jgi:nucleoside-diphosphate-sugar epimerase
MIYMVGRKFGTAENQELTWATNVCVPHNVAHHYRSSRIVVFSTGCVYPLVSAVEGGCTERTKPNPVGEYAQSCLGRERVFGYWSRVHGTPMSFVRLNYAVDLRYGVLLDIAQRVQRSEPVDLGVSHFNVIWQGDANNQALLCLEHCAVPPDVINITGPETVSVRTVAERFAELFGTSPVFTGDAATSRMYLSDATKALGRFGYPHVSLAQMIRWQGAWIQRGGRSLGKPTHFEATDGRF